VAIKIVRVAFDPTSENSRNDTTQAAEDTLNEHVTAGAEVRGFTIGPDQNWYFLLWVPE
jgi:hypothetical protein